MVYGLGYFQALLPLTNAFYVAIVSAVENSIFFHYQS